MRAPNLLAVTGLLWCLTANAAPPKLSQAKKPSDDLALERTLKALDDAGQTEGNDRATSWPSWCPEKTTGSAASEGREPGLLRTSSG